MMLQVLKNEKFLKYGRILFEVVRALYFIGGVLIGLFYLVVSDTNGRQSILQAAWEGLKDLLGFPLTIAFAAYIFAVFSYSKEQFIKRATWISLSGGAIYLITNMRLFYLPFNGLLYIGSVFIFYASTFWGMVGLCLPKDCFLDHQPTRTTQVLRIIFYFILFSTYFAFLLYYIFG